MEIPETKLLANFFKIHVDEFLDLLILFVLNLFIHFEIFSESSHFSAGRRVLAGLTRELKSVSSRAKNASKTAVIYRSHFQFGLTRSRLPDTLKNENGN